MRFVVNTALGLAIGKHGAGLMRWFLAHVALPALLLVAVLAAIAYMPEGRP